MISGGAWRKWCKRCGLALLLVEAIYLIGANVFLRTSLFERAANGNPEEIQVEIRSAYSLFPGWVSADRVQVRGQDTNVQWLLEVNRAKLWVSLPALMRRRFHVQRLDAGSGAFRIRLRNRTSRSLPEDLSSLPTIPGFGPETLLRTVALEEKHEHDLAEKAHPNEDGGLKQLRIENINIPAFRQLWVDGYRLDGRIQVGGSFTLDPGRRLVIPSGTLEIRSAALKRDDYSILEHVDGLVDATIRDFRAQEDLGLDFFRSVSFHVALRGGLNSFYPLGYLIKSQDWVSLKGVRGAFSIDVRAVDGRVVHVPAAWLDAESFEAAFSRFLVQGRAHAGFKLLDGVGTLEFKVPSYRISGLKSRSAIAEGSSMQISLESPDMSIARLYRRVTTRLSLPRARIRSLQFLNRWIPSSSGLAVRGGEGTLEASLSVDNASAYRVPSRGAGHLTLNLDRVRVKKGDHDLQGKVRTFLTLRQGASRGGLVEKDFEISGSEVSVSGNVAEGTNAWKTDLTVERGWLRPTASGPDETIEARFKVRMPDVSPFLAEFGVQSGLGKLAQDLAVAGKFEGKAHLRMGEGWLELDQVDLLSERSRIFGLLLLNEHSKQALALIHLGVIRLGLGLDSEGTHVQLLGADQWFEDKRLQILGAEPLSMR